MKKIFLFFLIFYILFAQETPEETTKTKDYKTYFIVSEVALGIGVYSWLLPSGLGLEGRLATALGLWTPAIFFFSSWKVPSVKQSGTPLQSLFGGVCGLARGYLLYDLYYAPYLRPKPYIPLIFSLGENIGGYFLSEELKFGIEDAWRYFNFNLLGAFHAGMVDIFTEMDWQDARELYFLLSAIYGYGGSILLRNEEKITSGDALAELEYIRLGITSPLAFLGGIRALSQRYIDEKIYAVSLFIGSCLGTYFGRYLSLKRDLTFGEALLINFAPKIIEGMVIGTGILIFKEFTPTQEGITLITLSIADPIGTILLDKVISGL